MTDDRMDKDKLVEMVERAFVFGFIAHMKNPRADPHNEWEASEIRRELAAALRSHAPK